jgi:hypothetical protein
MKYTLLICIVLGMDTRSALPSIPNYNFTETPTPSTLSEMPSILDAYNSKAVLNFGEPCSYKAEMEFLIDVISKSNLDGHDTSLVLFERERLLHGMKTLIQNSDGLCDHKKRLTCRKDNKCGCGSTTTSGPAEAEAGDVLAEDGFCKSGLPERSHSSCIISQVVQVPGSSSPRVADLTDFNDDSNDLIAADNQDQIAAAKVHIQTEITSFNESAMGQPIISSSSNITSPSPSSPKRIYENASAPNPFKLSHKYSEFSDSISTITICMHFFILISSIVIMMISFVLS